MSNKLKTLSAQKLEDLIAGSLGKYLNEECECSISELNTPNINSEDHIALHKERTLSFKVTISYKED